MNKFRILLLINNVSLGDSEKKISDIVCSIGFKNRMKINESAIECFKKSYVGFFSGDDSISTIRKLTKHLKEILDKNNVGALEFLLIDISDSNISYSIWHDGYY